MKTMYLILMLVLSGSAVAGPVDGRNNPLNLTEEQKQQMQALEQATDERLQAARKEIMADSKAQMAKFLTADQMKQFESMEAHRKQHVQLRHHHKKMKRKRNKEDRGD